MPTPETAFGTYSNDSQFVLSDLEVAHMNDLENVKKDIQKMYQSMNEKLKTLETRFDRKIKSLNHHL